MQRQTVDSILPLLKLLQQPAFCLRSNGTLICNESAKHLAPSCAAVLPQWLGEGHAMYNMWDRTGNLQLPLTLHGLPYNVCLQSLQDGTLFLLSSCSVGTETANALAVASQVLRRPLSDLTAVCHPLIAESGPVDPAAARRQLHCLTRIVSNLSELTRLSQPKPTLYPEQKSLSNLLDEFSEELGRLCEAAGRKLLVTLPKRDVTICADILLLKRAVLNLVSNALKFSPAGSDLALRIDTMGTHLVFQVENTCTDDGSELLRSAFNRLSRRDILPDPRWGVGIGLPLTNLIARLHGGMVAVETGNRKATVTFSVSLHGPETNGKLTSIVIDYTGGMRQSLLELADVLPNDVFKK